MIAAPAPSGPDWGDLALDLGVATLASAGVVGLLALDGGNGPIGRLGSLGQMAMIGAAVTLPPAILVSLRQETFEPGAYMASLSAGSLGLALGFAAARPILGENPSVTTQVLGFGTAALLQGLAAGSGYRLYQGYKATATDLDRLPESRTDDPIDNWNLKRERQQHR